MSESKIKLTPWYPGNVKPARAGVYEVKRRIARCAIYRYFDGKRWYYGGVDPKDAMYEFRIWKRFPHSQTPPKQQWRGLARKPK